MSLRVSQIASDTTSHSEESSGISADDTRSNGAKKKSKMSIWKRKKQPKEIKEGGLSRTTSSKENISDTNSERVDYGMSDTITVDSFGISETHISIQPSIKEDALDAEPIQDADPEKRKKRLSFWRKKKPQKEADTLVDSAEDDMVIKPDDDPETIQKKKRFWRRSGSRKAIEIGVPYNVVHKSHVDFDLQWTMHNPKETFEMLELLGSGTFGSVHKAKHRENGFILAIKSIKVKTEEGLEEVKSEINILKKLKHPNIVSYYGCCTINHNELWILMEYCNVGSVRDFMDMWPEPFSEDQIATILSHTVTGLAYLHENKIAHRDIKAANILLDGQGRSKIGDFGVAGQLTKSIGKLHDFVGTVLFMAPEMLKDHATYDLSADIWALGITSIELAEQGCVPYCTERIMTAIRKIVNNPPPTFTEPSKWSPQFRDFLTCCLQKDPKKRPKAKMLLMHPFLLSHRTDLLPNPIMSQSNHSTPASTPPQMDSYQRPSSNSSIQPVVNSNPQSNSGSANQSQNGSINSNMGSTSSSINKATIPKDPLLQPLLPKSKESPQTNSKCCCTIL